MAIGPSDYIDQLLAKRYFNEKVNNVDSDLSRLAISQDRYWEIMQDYAQVHRTLAVVSSKIANMSHEKDKLKEKVKEKLQGNSFGTSALPT